MAGGGNEFASTPQRLVLFAAEDSPSGLGRTLGKRVGGNPSRVRISYPPPVPHRARCRRAPPFAVGPFVVVRLSFRLWPRAGPRACRRPAAPPPPQHGPGDVHAASAHGGRSPRLPSHDRVDHDVRDAKDQEHSRRRVASVMTDTYVRRLPVTSRAQRAAVAPRGLGGASTTHPRTDQKVAGSNPAESAAPERPCGSLHRGH